jgi:uncharacterized protein YacL (UPF0231 family)
MRDKHTGPQKLSDQTRAVERAMRQAVEHALLTHKRAGNTVAAWKDGQVVLVRADNLRVEGLTKDKHK